MSRRTLIGGLVGLALVAVIGWMAANSSWVDIKVPMPPRGAAAENPFYGAQKLAAALGATSVRDRTLTVPATGEVLVLSAWNWSLSPRQRTALERWVERGGRLVVDPTVARDREFQRWSGVVLEIRSPSNRDKRSARGRAALSVEPPGAKLTTSLTGLFGYTACACAAVEMPSAASAIKIVLVFDTSGLPRFGTLPPLALRWVTCS